MRNMPIGIDDFETLITENYYFVDKTDFICQIIDKHSFVNLITRPRRFGKTLSMSMLEYFFSNHYKSCKNLFDGLHVQTTAGNYMEYQGKYPVIFLSLKEVSGEDFQEIQNDIIRIMSECYMKYSELENSDKLSERDKKFYGKICDEDDVSQSNLISSLKRLSYMLYKHYDEKVIILLDEYDAPVNKIADKTIYKKTINFIKKFMGDAFKTNPYVSFSIITGISRITKESIFSELNNLHVFSVLDERYNNIMGFTEEEIRQILLEYDNLSKLGEIKEWYDGYNFGGKEIYNPWSVIRYIDNNFIPETFWMNTSSNNIMHYFMNPLDEDKYFALKKLIRSERVYGTILDGITFQDIDNDLDKIYTLLLNTGYLSYRKCSSDNNYELHIPNKEVRLVFEQEVLKEVIVRPAQELTKELFSCMCIGNKDNIEKILSKLLIKYASFHDTANHESFYHGFMLGLSILAEDKFIVESNRETGYGRSDISLYPKKTSAESIGIIMEFKVADDIDSMQVSAQNALKQIKLNEYEVEMQKHSVRNILRYGISFCGKHVKVVS